MGEEDSHSVTKKIHIRDQEEALAVCGQCDDNLKKLEKKNNVVINARGGEVSVAGEQEAVDKTLKELVDFKEKKRCLSGPVSEDVLIKTSTGKSIKAISSRQSAYINAMQGKDLVISIGPAGTGKTFLACLEAVRCLSAGVVEKIILTRPVVEAGEKLGFLPGDLYEKVNPYLKPIYDAFHTIIGSVKFQKYRRDEIIEIVPLAYMRGRTLDNAMVILDEAQNTSSGQMQMFLTRLGFNSKAVITGDITQVDLESGQVSGLVEIQEVLKGMNEVEFIYFSKEDVVRHHLVKRIVDAYNQFRSNR
ncbi:PhoH family protein [Elusimicrobiota bacterium]